MQLISKDEIRNHKIQNICAGILHISEYVIDDNFIFLSFIEDNFTSSGFSSLIIMNMSLIRRFSSFSEIVPSLNVIIGLMAITKLRVTVDILTFEFEISKLLRNNEVGGQIVW